ncbi:MAG: GNAT family protein [Anaerococcus hydrogenalis]|uniref:GNAT family N-acetyltransferase n=1 Tax=Anaerococcus hydrogenalis TaxID=33029 RepID=UPI00290607AE|nr:GNAT family protein [Anaerococcus hydrogenalis]MDU3687499.1 GNAT family protein [Anaerococcus hydrogenalis]
MKIIGKDDQIYLKKIDLDDAYDLRKWDMHEDERLKGYNYGNFSQIDCEVWFMNVNIYRKRYFAVKKIEDDSFIAFIGLKNYNPILRKSELGIVFDPKYTSKGYGYKAMKILLDYYFNDLKFYELYLDVNDFNKRAFNLYDKLGFKKTGKTVEIFENQEICPDGENFILRNGKVYSVITKMRIRKDGR